MCWLDYPTHWIKIFVTYCLIIGNHHKTTRSLTLTFIVINVHVFLPALPRRVSSDKNPTIRFLALSEATMVQNLSALALWMAWAIPQRPKHTASPTIKSWKGLPTTACSKSTPMAARSTQRCEWWLPNPWMPLRSVCFQIPLQPKFPSLVTPQEPRQISTTSLARWWRCKT